VPTPFYHLWVAQDLLEHPGLSRGIRRFLSQYRAAFLFGNTAPDVQVVSGQPRQATHFFDVPLQPGQPSAVEAMLGEVSQLAFAYQLPPSQAAFLAGYICHLQADWLWVSGIFDPIFGARASWGRMADRLYIHNVIRVYQDRNVLTHLGGDTGQLLQAAHPDHWLPFVEDTLLCQWRDYLHPQLKPHATVQTVEVFAARQGIPAEAYYRLLDSRERMQQEVFVHLSPQQLEAYRGQLLAESVQLLRRYLEPPTPGAYRQASTGAVL
jgi:hypothetical protein